MNIPNIANLTPEEAREIPMVDLAYAILKEANNPMYYRDLMQEIARIKGLGEEDVNRVIAQVYTEINIDGRFACVGNNLWGLKRWYPVERSEDAVGSHPRIINDEDDDDLDDPALFGEEDEEYAESGVDYEALDEDEDEVGELFDDEEEIVPEDLDDDPVLDEVLDEDIEEEEEELADEEAEDDFDR